jgi:hypothetical protein
VTGGDFTVEQQPNSFRLDNYDDGSTVQTLKACRSSQGQPVTPRERPIPFDESGTNHPSIRPVGWEMI